MMRAWMPISKLLKAAGRKNTKGRAVQDNAAPAPESGLEVRQSPLKPNIGQRASLLLCAIVPVRDGQLLGKPTPSTIAISNCVHPLRQRFWHFVFSREQLTGCGHCLPLSSNRPPLSGPKVQKRPRGYFCFSPPCPSLISSFQPTEDQRPAKKKPALLSVPPYLRSYRTGPHHHAPPQIPLRPLSSSTTTQPHHPIPPSTPRAPGCPRPRPFNTFQLPSSSCFTSSIELSPFPCHHPATSSITPRCLPRRAPPPRR